MAICETGNMSAFSKRCSNRSVYCFRYIKYINNYRVYQASYMTPEFVEPPSFLREYETQVCYNFLLYQAVIYSTVVSKVFMKTKH